MTFDEQPSYFLRDGDLLKYLEGAGSPELNAYVESSPELMAEVAALRDTEATLVQMQYREACPDMDSLLMYEAGLHPTRQQSIWHEHVKQCVLCQDELRLLQVDVQPEVERKQIPLSDILRGVKKRLLEAVRIKGPDGKYVYSRGDDRLTERHAIGSYIVTVVKLKPIVPGANWELEARLREGAPPHHQYSGSAELLNEKGELVAEDYIDQFGYFNFGSMPDGIYTMRLELYEDILLLKIEMINDEELPDL